MSVARPPEEAPAEARKGEEGAPANPPPPPVAEPAPPAKASFWRTLRIVGWGFLGVRKNSEYQRDLAQVNPFHVILAGIIGAVLLVLLLLGIVSWVVSSATPAA